MAAPLTPEPPERSSSANRKSDASAGGSRSMPAEPVESSIPDGPNDLTAVIHATTLKPPSSVETSSTVISSARQRTAPDALHAEGLVGRKLGQFELLESVGVGGMAAVIRAQDLDLGRTVALKILPPDMAADPENISRFRQEARSAARLDHENIARVYFCGEDQGLHFISFEFVEGENLRVLMEKRGGLLPVTEALHYLIQITAGLAHAASRGVVHRDIKPSNIIITPEGKAKIVDMGLARNLDPRSSEGQLTQSGVTLGTFDYISPEQAIEPRSADCRSDIYSLGCTFYHITTGRLPVPEGTAAKKLYSHQNIEPLDPRELNPNIPDEMVAILGKMMAKDVTQRYQHPDHLLQHLLILAKKLNVSTGLTISDSEYRASPYVEPPLPSPPSLSPMWIGVTIVVMIVGLFAITGGFGDGKKSLDSQPFWQTNLPAKEISGGPSAPADAGNPKKEIETSPVAAKGYREANTVADFVTLLRQPSAKIRLKAGAVYDLTRRKDGELPKALFVGGDLAIEGERLHDPPTIKLLMAAPDDGETARPGTLTIRGPVNGSSAKVLIRGVRFEFVADESEVGQSGLNMIDIDQIDVEDCSFIPPLNKGIPKDGAAAVSIDYRIVKDSMPEARLDRCYFAPGSIAVQLVKYGPLLLKATECAFGPQYAVFRMQDHGTSELDGLPAVVRMESCTALMTSGAVVEIADQVPCKVRAGYCLFSNPELRETDTSKAFVVRQIGVMATETRFEGGVTEKIPPMPMANGYQNILAYGTGSLGYTFDECKAEQIPVDDAAARILTKSPWKEEQPVTRLYDFPRQTQQVFTVDLKQEILRPDPGRKNLELLGAKHLPGMSIHTFFPFESPRPEPRLAANEKIWQPDFPLDKLTPPNVYRSLSSAIVDLKKGDIILIRHNGPIDVDPAEFKKADTDVTIRADAKFKPILIPRVPELKNETALFKLYGGQLVLENLRFRLKPDRAPAIVALPGGGQCTFRNCFATLEEGEDLCIVSLADPRGEMMLMGTTNPKSWPVPKILIENSFIRGRGRTVHVQGSRPFEFKMKNSLVVLDGSLIGIEPSAADLAEAGPAQVSLERVTAYFTKNLLWMKASEKRAERNGLGLVQVQFHAEQSLFVPAIDPSPLVQLDRIDTMEQMDAVFLWKDCKQNVYGFKSDQEMLRLQPENFDSVVRPERVDRDRWLGKWREADYAFGEVNFNVINATQRFDGVKLGDFEVKSINPPLLPETSAAYGASIQALRKLSVDE